MLNVGNLSAELARGTSKPLNEAIALFELVLVTLNVNKSIVTGVVRVVRISVSAVIFGILLSWPSALGDAIELILSTISTDYTLESSANYLRFVKETFVKCTLIGRLILLMIDLSFKYCAAVNVKVAGGTSSVKLTAFTLVRDAKASIF